MNLAEQFPPNDFTLLGLILALPLLGALVNGIFGKRLGKDGVRLAALATVGGSFLLGLLAFAMVVSAPAPPKGPVRLVWTAWEWFSVTGGSRQNVPIDVSFSIDPLSAVMLLVVTGVGWLIHLYSTGYMAKDPGYHRYFAYLNLFIFSMLVLILGDNLAVLFVGWEGVGLCSYLLIGFWFEDEAKASAGKKAFIANRIGDFGLLVAMAILIHHVGSLGWGKLESVSGGMDELVTLWPPAGMSLHSTELPGFIADWLTPDKRWQASVGTLVALFLFLGCAGKSAQIPLYVWLPDAMAGPTPVSALIHAATMVTAGVYLVARCSFIFVVSPFAMAVVAGIGALTALFAATIAFAQNDLKKVLAYSTVSQLGFMFVGVGVGAFAAGMFHVVTHAFFKGCLFLCAGSVIHAMHAHIHDDTSQDMRKMGGLRHHMPITHLTFLVSCFAIAGAPPLSGFWSKDEILFKAYIQQIRPLKEALWTPPPWYGQLIYAIALLAAVGTAFYMFRAYFMTFWGKFRGWKIAPRAKRSHHPHDAPLAGPAPKESPRVMTVPLVILAALAAVAGFVNLEPVHFVPFQSFLDPVFATAVGRSVSAVEGGEALMWPLLAVGVAVFLAGAGAAYWVYVLRQGAPAQGFVESWPRLYRLVYDKWKIDELYQATVIGMVEAMGETAAQFDKYVIDGIIAKLTSKVVALFGIVLRTLQTGRVQVYAAAMVLGVAGMGWFLLMPHADARVDASELETTGQVVLTAAPGHGYKYRWHAEGEEPPLEFTAEASHDISLRPCEQKTVVLAVQNVLGQEDEQRITQCRYREGAARCCLPASELGPESEPAPDGGGAQGRPINPQELRERLRDLRGRGLVPGGQPPAPGAPPPADRAAQPGGRP